MGTSQCPRSRTLSVRVVVMGLKYFSSGRTRRIASRACVRWVLKALLEGSGGGGWISSFRQASEAGRVEGGGFSSAPRAEGGRATAGF